MKDGMAAAAGEAHTHPLEDEQAIAGALVDGGCAADGDRPVSPSSDDRAQLVVLFVYDQLPQWAYEKYFDLLSPEGGVRRTRDAGGETFDWRQLTGDLLRVKTAPSRPPAAAVAVPYRGHWFYIEDADLESKSTFALLLELFNMSADASLVAAPTLTLPIGG